MVMIQPSTNGRIANERWWPSWNEGFTDTSEATVDDEFVEDDDRVKFSRIPAALKENSAITLMELGTMGIEAMRELIAKTLEVNSTAVNDDFVKLLDQKYRGIPMYLSSMTNWLKSVMLSIKMMMELYFSMATFKIYQTYNGYCDGTH